VRDRDLARSAGLRGLPTLDIGRRRLMGEQSEAELREAVEAALPR
jgi:protein-disulfide isomerase